jgi:hypothetical protein
MSNFINFKEINLDVPSGWKGKRILSFDVDWALDEVIEDVISLIEEVNIKCTFFITHTTDLLSRMRNNPNIELGIHPNFNPLLDSELGAKTAVQTIESLMNLVPEATVLRSHSMTHSGRWLTLYKEFGITHLSQYYMNGIDTIQPFRHVNGIIETPVYFADDGYIYINDHKKWDNHSMDRVLSKNEYIKVYNFHPIHVALNTNSFSFYNKTRESHRNWEELIKIRSNEFGVKDILINLIK